MSASRPANEFNDELLSAYVDNELTADELSLVEERLRVDPRARKLVDELRRTSEAVKSLPRQTLGRDLRADLWAEIERRRPTPESAHVLKMPAESRGRSAGNRGLLWAAMAVAAALMLMMALRPADQQRDRELARATADRDKLEQDERRGPNAIGAAAPSGGPRTPSTSSAASADGARREARQTRPEADRELRASSTRKDGADAALATGLDDARVEQAAAAANFADRIVELPVADDDDVARFAQTLAARDIAVGGQPLPDDLAAAWSTLITGELDKATDESTAAAFLVEATPAEIDALLGVLRAADEASSEPEAKLAADDDSAERTQLESLAAGRAWQLPLAEPLAESSDASGAAILSRGGAGGFAGAARPAAASQTGPIRVLILLRKVER